MSRIGGVDTQASDAVSEVSSVAFTSDPASPAEADEEMEREAQAASQPDRCYLA